MRGHSRGAVPLFLQMAAPAPAALCAFGRRRSRHFAHLSLGLDERHARADELHACGGRRRPFVVGCGQGDSHHLRHAGKSVEHRIHPRRVAKRFRLHHAAFAPRPHESRRVSRSHHAGNLRRIPRDDVRRRACFRLRRLRSPRFRACQFRLGRTGRRLLRHQHHHHAASRPVHGQRAVLGEPSGADGAPEKRQVP